MSYQEVIREKEPFTSVLQQAIECYTRMLNLEDAWSTSIDFTDNGIFAAYVSNSLKSGGDLYKGQSIKICDTQYYAKLEVISNIPTLILVNSSDIKMMDMRNFSSTRKRHETRITGPGVNIKLTGEDVTFSVRRSEIDNIQSSESKLVRRFADKEIASLVATSISFLESQHRDLDNGGLRVIGIWGNDDPRFMRNYLEFLQNWKYLRDNESIEDGLDIPQNRLSNLKVAKQEIHKVFASITNGLGPSQQSEKLAEWEWLIYYHAAMNTWTGNLMQKLGYEFTILQTRSLGERKTTYIVTFTKRQSS